MREHASGRACLSWACVGVSLFLLKFFLLREGFLLRANEGETAGKRPALAGRLLCGNALWVFAFSTQMPLASADDYEACSASAHPDM